jgi:hypothetical protein
MNPALYATVIALVVAWEDHPDPLLSPDRCVLRRLFLRASAEMLLAGLADLVVG